MFKGFIYGVPVFIAFHDLVGYVAMVEGVSMRPVLNPEGSTSKDVVYLSRSSRKTLDYQRGEVVSLVCPKDPSHSIIKRIIALEGDYIRTISYRQRYLKVPPGHCWVEGDNTRNSYDSNFFGPVSLGLVTARAPYVIWPPSRWRRLESEVPYARSPINLSRSGGEDITTPIELKDMIEEVD